MKKIRTVLGDIAPEELGFTSMHEHTIAKQMQSGLVMMKNLPTLMKAGEAYQNGEDVKAETQRRIELGINDFPKMTFEGSQGASKLFKKNPARKLNDIEYFTNELLAFKNAGGNALLDCSPFARVSSDQYQELSKKSGIHLLTCSGFYVKAGIPKKYRKGGILTMRHMVEYELEHGDGKSSARPGFLKCAFGTLENGMLAESEKNALITCASVAEERGMAIEIHLAFPLRQQHVLEAADILINSVGISSEKVVFCHLDSISLGAGNPVAKINEYGYDATLALKLVDKGFNVSFDAWGNAMGDRSMTDYLDDTRYVFLKEMISQGYAEHIVLGHDLLSKAAGVQNGGCGYTRFPNYLREHLPADGLNVELLDVMAVKNPARILAF
ncbi:MAG: hypothetical protein Q4B22_03850 [Eubacteriales bacterium]|nr:hypothetical protein [Eubacteriales bacterium]